ncbi:MAG: TerB family tellurite resistance protein [Polyangiaceae bacterium]|nr:TerB family tellurite resistance protein [Polyangiaceae bacterium]
MHEQEYAIVSALVPVAWADGIFADKEKEMLDALLDAYGASEKEKASLRDYAKDRRMLEDIKLQDLSAGDRRVLLQLAVLLSFADGKQDELEVTFLRDLADYLRIPTEESKRVMAEAETRARKHLNLL